MIYFLSGFIVGILATSGFVIWLMSTKKLDLDKDEIKFSKPGKAQFIDPVPFKEKFDKSNNITDLLE